MPLPEGEPRFIGARSSGRHFPMLSSSHRPCDLCCFFARRLRTPSSKVVPPLLVPGVAGVARRRGQCLPRSERRGIGPRPVALVQPCYGLPRGLRQPSVARARAPRARLAVQKLCAMSSDLVGGRA
eukprot:13392981-Alexandrium_andersonii.AAC.1